MSSLPFAAKPSRPFLRKAVCAAILAAVLPFATPSAVAQTSNNRTGIYYDSGQPGWGVNLVHQGTTLVVTWYTYASDGKPMWVLGALNQQADGSFSGAISRYTGTAFNLISGKPASTGSTQIGTATAVFDSAGKLSFGYTINGVTQIKIATPLALNANPPTCSFTSASRASATNYTDLWWNPAESGWGATLAHQGDSIFVAWYTYDASGRDQWITSSVATKQADGSYQGVLSRPSSGTPYDRITGAATTFPLPSVGSVTLRFTDGENGTMSYTLDGITQSKSISRFAFGSPVHVCTESGPTSPPVATTKCYPPLLAGDTYSRRTTSQGSTAQTSETYGDTGTFEGKTYRILDQFNSKGQRQARLYFTVDATTHTTYAAETFDPASGTVIGTTKYVPPVAFNMNPTLGQTETVSYTAVNNTQGFQTETKITESHKLVGYEDVTVPAGRFTGACKFEDTVSSKQSLFGAEVSVEAKMTNWVNQVGQLKNFTSATTTSSSSTTTESTTELLSAKTNGVSYPQ